MSDAPWNPDAPSLRALFEQARDDTAKSPNAAQPEHGISTAAELQQREAARSTPVLEPRLTIGGRVEQAVHQTEQADNELRAQFLKRSLQKASNRLREDFDRSR